MSIPTELEEKLLRELAEKYSRDVEARKELGDSHAEYHAQKPKNEAYKLLLSTGLSPKEAVEVFKELLKKQAKQ